MEGSRTGGWRTAGLQHNHSEHADASPHATGGDASLPLLHFLEQLQGGRVLGLHPQQLVQVFDAGFDLLDQGKMEASSPSSREHENLHEHLDRWTSVLQLLTFSSLWA